MRKLLLASAAILGAGGLAHAQGVASNPSQGSMMAPAAPTNAATYNPNTSTWANPRTISGSAAAGGLSNYGSMAGTAYPVPTPGTIVIRLGGKVEADVTINSSSLSTYQSSGVTYKTNPILIGSYMRLYPGFDGMAANGVRYGAQIELRENFQGALPAGSASSTLGIAQSSAPSSPSANTSLQTVLVRRAFTYLAADQVGIVRLGQGDGVIGLFDNCIFSTQCWDAGIGVFQGPIFGGYAPTNISNGASNYPWLAQAGAEYGNNKIVYLSPQYFGFDLALSYAPSQGNAEQATSGNVGVTGAQSLGVPNDNNIQTVTGATTNRWYNQFEAGLRYEHTFEPVDVKWYGMYMHANREDVLSTGTLTSGTSAVNYDAISLYQTGLAVTTSGVTAAVTYQTGQVNNQLSLLQSGGAPMQAVVAGLTYQNGPWTLGAVGGIINNQGAQGAFVGHTQRHQAEFMVGGNYKMAPGVNLVLEYGYIQEHQGGVNLATGAAGAAYNDVKTQGLLFSTMLTW